MNLSPNRKVRLQIGRTAFLAERFILFRTPAFALHSQQPDKWKTIAWNGIKFATPVHWHPTVVLHNHLVFEADYLPIFEIKWQLGKRVPSAPAIIKQLQKSQNIHIQRWNVLTDWLELLQSYHLDGFRWGGDEPDSYNGYGLLLIDEARGLAIILQFHNLKEHHLSLFTPLLASLIHQKGVPDTPLDWSIFDIQVQLPAAAQLKSHEFFPGNYSLVFTFEKNHLALMRFKPAKELLRNTCLVDFGNQLTKNELHLHDEDETDYFHSATWLYEAQGRKRLLRKLKRQPGCRMLQLTHHVAENVILGVQMEGSSRIIFDTTHLISSTFKPISA